MLLGVPLVDEKHRGFARFLRISRHSCVLRGDSLRRVNHHQCDLAALDGFARRNHRQFFRLLGRLSFTANSCCIDDEIAAPVARDFGVDCVASRPRDWRDNRAFLVRQPIQQ